MGRNIRVSLRKLIQAINETTGNEDQLRDDINLVIDLVPGDTVQLSFFKVGRLRSAPSGQSSYVIFDVEE